MSADPRLELARRWLAEDSRTPVDHMPPSQLMKSLESARRHLAAVLDARPEAFRPMDTSDINPATGECWGVIPEDDAPIEAG